MADTLVLNADGAPISLLPISTIDWQEAIKYLVLDKCQVVFWHNNWTVRSANWETRVPSVIILKEYMKSKSIVRFSKNNVFLRDLYICSYCEKQLEKKDCTLDHVLPVSHGGKTTFDNTVTACGVCNSKKGNNHRIRPKFKPHKPSIYELINNRKRFPFNVKHSDWLEFLK
jgi:5-methylcytosine-specific restriction endonuclease McrA